MKLWLVKRSDDADYDQYDRFVCAANSEPEARKMHPTGPGFEWNGKEWREGVWLSDTWVDPTTVLVEEIGNSAADRIGVICASFNAG